MLPVLCAANTLCCSGLKTWISNEIVFGVWERSETDIIDRISLDMLCGLSCLRAAGFLCKMFWEFGQ